jgi:hypothetical protein
MRKNILILLTLLIIETFAHSQTNSKTDKTQDFVPDEQTAMRIAEAIWLPIYGEKVLDQKPFVAKLVKNKVWVVEGYLSPEAVGGIPHIEIQKSDCKILKVYHTK